MLFVKINFQIRLESVYLARRRGSKTAREGTASGGKEESCSPSRVLGRGTGHSSTAAGHRSEAKFAPSFVTAILSMLSPKSLVEGHTKASPTAAPSPLCYSQAGLSSCSLVGAPNVLMICFVSAKVFWSSAVAVLNSHALQNEWSHAEGRLIDYGNNGRSFFPLINQISHTFLED